MSESLENLMHEATEHLAAKWDPPEAIRRRGDRRRVGRRVAAALVAATALGVGGTTVLGPTGSPQPPEPDSTTASCVADMTLPQSESEVKIRVYHPAISVASSVAADFKARRFEVEEATTTTESIGEFSAVIRYGPAEVGEARLVQAHLLPDLVYMDFDQNKKGTVDVILGTRFTRLVTITQMREQIVALGSPEPPC